MHLVRDNEAPPAPQITFDQFLAVDAEQLDADAAGALEVGRAGLDVGGETHPGRVFRLLPEDADAQVLRQVGIVVERQVDLGGEESWTGRVDFLVVGLPIIIEVQSELHHAALVDRVADDARRARLEADGFTVVELWDTEVWSHPSVAVARVAAAVATHRSVRSITTSEL